MQQAHGQSGAGQLGDVVDDELGVGGSGAHGVPVPGNRVLRQVEVDGRDGCDGIHAAGFGMGGQLHRVGGVVAGHMGNDRDLALGLAHHGLQHGLALIRMLVDALPGRASHVDALDPLGDQVTGQSLCPFNRNMAILVVAGIECGKNALILFNVFHSSAFLNVVSMDYRRILKTNLSTELAW